MGSRVASPHDVRAATTHSPRAARRPIAHEPRAAVPPCVMGYRTLRACIDDLAATGQLRRIDQEIDPHLEAAAIHRRVFQAGGPALYFARREGLPVSDGQQPVRHARAGAVSVSRHARLGATVGRAQGRSRAVAGAGPGDIAARRARSGDCCPAG